MCFFKRRSGPRYVVLEMVKPNEVERDEAEYRSAYLLLVENVRMQLTVAPLRPGGSGHLYPRVTARAQ